MQEQLPREPEAAKEKYRNKGVYLIYLGGEFWLHRRRRFGLVFLMEVVVNRTVSPSASCEMMDES
jgi:hypothetical protein